jgi:membrane protease YdiL (CAAX protease family)
MPSIKRIFGLVLETRPFAQALVLTWLVIALTWSIPALLLPPNVQLNLGFSAVPDPEVFTAAADSSRPVPLGEDFPGCYWTHQPPASLAAQDSDQSHFHAYCLQADTAIAGADGAAPDNTLHRFQQDDDWQLHDHSWTFDGVQFGWIAYLALLVPALATIVLLRNLPLREDLVRAGSSLLTRPWLLAILPAIMILTLLLASLLPFGAGHLPDAPVNSLFEHLPFVAAYLMVMAVFEEAAFRQWAYRRSAGRLPVWALAACSGWFFMLAHIFNPQAKAAPGYLLAIALIGMTLFWMRHRYKSFSLAAIAHSGNNLLFVIAALVMSR